MQPVHLSPAQIKRHIDDAHVLRSRAMSEMFRALWRGLTHRAPHPGVSRNASTC